jgi:sigma-E factor negative regulatory protein RseA
MNDALKEQVSALSDNELQRQEEALLLRRLTQTPELGAQLGRYALIGEAMRRALPPVVDTGLAARVSAAIAEEEALQAQPRRLPRALLRPVAGIAVAASVAALSLAVWPTANVPRGGEGAEVAAAAAAAPPRTALQRVGTTEEPSQWDRLDPEIQQRLNGYLVNHSEHTPTGRMGGMIHYVRITGQHGDE